MSVGLNLPAPELDLVLLDSEEHTSIDKLRAGGILVMDLWSTRCERCPAALDKVNEIASGMSENMGAVFVSVNCDDADFAQELVEENGWDKMKHCFADEATKNVVKEKLGLKAFPFLVVVGKDGLVAHAGPANKDVDLAALVRQLATAGPNEAAAAPQEEQQLVLDADF